LETEHHREDERRRDMGPDARREPIHPWRWKLLSLWIILFTLFAFWSIRDARHERLKACILTHESIREVFRPFFAGAPPVSIHKFNTQINSREKQCKAIVNG